MGVSADCRAGCDLRGPDFISAAFDLSQVHFEHIRAFDGWLLLSAYAVAKQVECSYGNQ
jgi:hypothetical protein